MFRYSTLDDVIPKFYCRLYIYLNTANKYLKTLGIWELFFLTFEIIVNFTSSKIYLTIKSH